EPLVTDDTPVSSGATTTDLRQVERYAANRARRTAGGVAGGVGLAVLAAGGVFGVLAIVNNDDARSCPQPFYAGKEPGVDSDQATNRALAFANVANVLVPLGLVGIGIGGWLVLTAGPASPGSPVASRSGATLGFGRQW